MGIWLWTKEFNFLTNNSYLKIGILREVLYDDEIYSFPLFACDNFVNDAIRLCCVEWKGFSMKLFNIESDLKSYMHKKGPEIRIVTESFRCHPLSFFVVYGLALLVNLTFSTRCNANNNIINIPDKHLEDAIYETLNETSHLTKSKMLELTHLENYGGQITDLMGLEHATNLEKLIISENQLKDISPLACLLKLRVLALWGNQIEDVSILKEHINLSELSLSDNKITDISPISKLTNLTKLTLTRNPLNNDAYEVYIPIIIRNNPNIILYHDRTLTPEKSLAWAKKLFLPIVGIISLIVFSFLYYVSKSNSVRINHLPSKWIGKEKDSERDPKERINK